MQKGKALETQVQFRRYVVGNKNTNNVLDLSAEGHRLSLETFMTNLKTVNQTAQDETTDLAPCHPVATQPLSDDTLLDQKRKFQELVSKQLHKTAWRTPPADKRIQVQDPEDLVGKRVSHLCEVEDKEQLWYSSIVTSVTVPTRGYNKGRCMYIIKYDNFGDEFGFPLLEDLTAGDLGIEISTGAFFVGRE